MTNRPTSSETVMKWTATEDQELLCIHIHYRGAAMSRNRRREELRKRGHSNARPKWKTLYWVLSLLVAVLAVSGIGWMLIRHPGIGSGIESVSLAPVSLLSEKVSGAPWVVKQAYRFAIANPDTLSNFPCYCGCGSMGHQSNLDCFVQQFNADGSVVLDNHALG